MRYPIRNKIRKLMNRSATQECAICGKKGIPLKEHHIQGRDIPNYNHPNNRCSICGNCHDLIHYGIIIIEGWFQTSNGKELLWHEVNKPSFSGQDSISHLIPNVPTKT